MLQTLVSLAVCALASRLAGQEHPVHTSCARADGAIVGLASDGYYTVAKTYEHNKI